jgi:hypothetical protein
MVDGVKHYLKKGEKRLPRSTTAEESHPMMMSLLLVPLLFAEGVAL